MKKLIKCKNGIVKEMSLEETITEFQKILNMKEIMKWCVYYEKDDLMQIGYIGIMKAYKYYDVSQNMSFVGYAKKIIQDTIINTYKSDKRQKRGGDLEFTSIYSIVDDTNVEMIETIKDENVNCEASALSNIMNEKISEVLNTFSEQDQEMINLHFMKGLTGAEIGRMYNKTRACISHRLKVITDKLQKQLINEVAY